MQRPEVEVWSERVVAWSVRQRRLCNVLMVGQVEGWVVIGWASMSVYSRRFWLVGCDVIVGSVEVWMVGQVEGWVVIGWDGRVDALLIGWLWCNRWKCGSVEEVGGRRKGHCSRSSHASTHCDPLEFIAGLKMLRFWWSKRLKISTRRAEND